MKISIGNIVRSYDFHYRELDGEHACFVEGIVEDITDPESHDFFGDCARYAVRVSRRVFGGVECVGENDTGELVFPPVNGTPTWGDHVTSGVEVIF